MLSVRHPVALLVGFSALTSAGGLSAWQEEVRVARGKQVEEAPVIDGRVDENVWMEAEVITGFIQAEPLEGEPATETTEVRILYDDRAIYFGVICYDSDPSLIIVTDSRRDANVYDMDSFLIILDTYHDKQSGFVFGTNPVGIEYDGQVTDEGEGGGGGRRRAQSSAGAGFNLNWDASWQVRTHINEIGWMAEFAIPLRTLRYESRQSQVWGLNFQRNIRRNRENVYWSPVSRIYNLYRVSSAGELHDLQLKTPRNFKVTPYVLGSNERIYTDSPANDYDGEVGVDAKLGVTPSLNLDLTYNTDFAQVEVDEQQINFTRFNLFFPEKRPFFLENAGFFTMGKSREVELFFSRRIGISEEDGIPVPILAGARLSGKAGNYNIGFLNMQTEELLPIALPNNYTVASVSRDFPNRSRLGALFLNRVATGDLAGDDNWNRTFGIDGQLGIGEMWTFNGFAARTATPGATDSETAFNVRGEYKRLGGSVNVEYTEVGDDFNPEVGFLTREGYRNLESTVFKNVRTPQVDWLRELRPHTSYRGFWDFTGFKETERIHIDSHVDFENGAFFSPAFNFVLEGLQAPFDIHTGVVVAPGTYRNTELAWRWNTNQAYWIAYSGQWDYGGFLSGRQNQIGSTLTLRKGSQLNASLTWRHSQFDLAEGSFTTNLGQFRLNYSFTPLIYLQSLIQYNDSEDVWAANIRFSWLSTAGTGLFIVFNTSEGLGDLLIGPQNRSFVIKYTHQFDILH
jgi:hypothetical protein